MLESQADFAWDNIKELRQELTGLQRIRAQLIGVKITFVSAGIGLIASNNAHPILYFIPAFASVFFDFLIQSYSFSIKRTGYYCRKYLEPLIKEHFQFPKTFILWEQFMDHEEAGKNIGHWGGYFITLMVSVPVLYAVSFPVDLPYLLNVLVPDWVVPISLMTTLAVLLYFDFQSFHQPNTFVNKAIPISLNRRPRPGVGVFIVRRTTRTEVLLAVRKYEPQQGKLDIPGGFIEQGESAEQAAVREIKEETGLEIEIDEFLGGLSDVYGADEMPTLNLCYLAKIVDGEEKAMDDVEELKWYPVNGKPPEMAFCHQREAFAILQRTLKGRRVSRHK